MYITQQFLSEIIIIKINVELKFREHIKSDSYQTLLQNLKQTIFKSIGLIVYVILHLAL